NSCLSCRLVGADGPGGLASLVEQDPADEGVALLALEPKLVRPGAIGERLVVEEVLRLLGVGQGLPLRRLLRLRLRLRLGGFGGRVRVRPARVRRVVSHWPGVQASLNPRSLNSAAMGTRLSRELRQGGLKIVFALRKAGFHGALLATLVAVVLGASSTDFASG